MLALTIFAMAMATLVALHARGSMNEMRARKLTVATELARQKMVDTQLDIEKEMNKGVFPEEKTDEGEFEKPFEDYRWKMEIRKVELPMPPLGEEAGVMMKQMMEMITKQISDSVRELKLTISWKEMEKERSFSVVTHIAKL